MDVDEALAYCLAKPGAWRDEPWEDVTVAKVGDRIFAFLGAQGSSACWVKCGRDRDEANEWIARYPGDASPSPYLGRFGWNALHLDGAIPADELQDAIDTSYGLVLARLPRRHRIALPAAGLSRMPGGAQQ
jgi:predicted DNA-binding protein (MmcQ/YjbR family)